MQADLSYYLVYDEERVMLRIKRWTRSCHLYSTEELVDGIRLSTGQPDEGLIS